jgi:hypothetical protein
MLSGQDRRDALYPKPPPPKLSRTSRHAISSASAMTPNLVAGRRYGG